MRAITGSDVGLIRPSALQASGRTLDQFRANLNIGDVIRGRVIGSLDSNKALISFRGLNIVTEMATVPNRGEIIHARILSLGDQIAMRVIQPDSTGVHSSTRIADFLGNVNLPVTDQTQAFARALLQHNLPVTQENMESLIQYATWFGAGTNTSLELIALSWLLNLPPNSHLFEALRSLFGGRERIGTQLENLRSLLAGLLGETPDGIDPALVRNLLQFIEHTAQGKFSSQIQQFMEQLGLGYEARLFATLGDSKLLREFFHHSNSNLKGLLLRLRSQILLSKTQNNVPTPVQQRLDQVMQALDGILTNIDAQEIAVSRELANENQFYLQIPYWLGNEPSTAEILGKSPRSGVEHRLDPDNMTLELLVETAHLGTLKFHLHTLQRQMNCTILAEHSEYSDFINMHKGDLLSRIRGLNYDTKDILLRVAESEDLHLELVSPSPALKGEFVRIDATA